MLNLNHKKLDVWKLSVVLTKDVYKLTEKFPKSEIYGISSQMRRAAVSVASNIAEGSSRRTALERKRFYEISRSSLIEIDTQLEICYELGLLIESDLENWNKILNILFAKITNLINSTK
jgi:four helix bundle protein